MLLHLSGTASAAHANILNTSAKARHLMPFKMTQADKHIRVHDSAADLCLFHHLAALNRHSHIICSF